MLNKIIYCKNYRLRVYFSKIVKEKLLIFLNSQFEIVLTNLHTS